MKLLEPVFAPDGWAHLRPMIFFPLTQPNIRGEVLCITVMVQEKDQTIERKRTYGLYINEDALIDDQVQVRIVDHWTGDMSLAGVSLSKAVAPTYPAITDSPQLRRIGEVYRFDGGLEENDQLILGNFWKVKYGYSFTPFYSVKYRPMMRELRELLAGTNDIEYAAQWLNENWSRFSQTSFFGDNIPDNVKILPLPSEQSKELPPLPAALLSDVPELVRLSKKYGWNNDTSQEQWRADMLKEAEYATGQLQLDKIQKRLGPHYKEFATIVSEIGAIYADNIMAQAGKFTKEAKQAAPVMAVPPPITHEKPAPMKHEQPASSEPDTDIDLDDLLSNL